MERVYPALAFCKEGYFLKRLQSVLQDNHNKRILKKSKRIMRTSIIIQLII